VTAPDNSHAGLAAPSAPSTHSAHSARALLESPEFRRLVTMRWRVSMTLTAALCVMYYGYVLLIATNKALLARRIGDVMTLGIPLGVAIILGAWALTAIYVVWANRRYDVEVRRLRDRLTH
jgi:uncharacterized membrane protein (DUF485 family)